MAETSTSTGWDWGNLGTIFSGAGEMFAGLGSTIGAIKGDGGSKPDQTGTPMVFPDKKPNSATPWIIGGIGVVVVGLLVVLFLKKKPA